MTSSGHKPLHRGIISWDTVCDMSLVERPQTPIDAHEKIDLGERATQQQIPSFSPGGA